MAENVYKVIELVGTSTDSLGGLANMLKNHVLAASFYPPILARAFSLVVGIVTVASVRSRDSRCLALLGFLMVAMSAQNVLAQESCPDLGGKWWVTETVTLVTTINGETETVTETAGDTVEMTQDACTVRYIRSVPLSFGGGTEQIERVGVISGNTITFTGIAAVPANGATCGKNSFIAVGIIDGKRIDVTTTIDVQCTSPNIEHTVTGNGKATFSRGPGLSWVATASGAAADGIASAVGNLGNSYVLGSLGGSFTTETSTTFGVGEPNQTILVHTDDSATLFIAKYDPAGGLIWAKHAVQGALVGRGIGIDAAGNSYITGFFFSASFAPGEQNQITLLATKGLTADIFIAKYDPNGALVWAKQAGGPNLDFGESIAVDDEGNSYVTGLFDASPGFSPVIFGLGEPNETALTVAGIFTAKYDTNGNLAWVKGVNSRLGPQIGLGIAIDHVGNSYVTGEFAAAGSTTFGAGEVNETNLVGTGLINVLLGTGTTNMFLAKYDPNGALVWAKQAGADEGQSIAVDDEGNSYVTGTYTRDPAVFGAGEANETSLESLGHSDIFLAKYDSTGSLQWVTSSGGRERDSTQGIAVDGFGNAYVIVGIRNASRGEFLGSVGGPAIRLTSFTGGAVMAQYHRDGILGWFAFAAGTSIASDSAGNFFLTSSSGDLRRERTFGWFEPNETSLPVGTSLILAKFGPNDSDGETILDRDDQTVLVANFLNGNNSAFNSRIYLWNPSASAGNVSVRVFTLPVSGGTAQELTTTPLNLGTLGARSALNIKLAEDILAPLGISLPYTDNEGDLTLEFTIEAANVRGAAQVFSSSVAFGTYPLQKIPSTSGGSPTVLVANFMNGNEAVFDSRVYLFNPSTSAGNVMVRVFTLPLGGGLAQELTAGPLVLGPMGAKSALNIKLAEDILTPLGIPTPYVNDGGNLTLEFTIEAADVVGAAQVFSSSFGFGVYPLQKIPSISAGSPTVMVANFLNGNSDAFNSRVYLWNPSASAGDVSVRVFSLPLKNGTAQELTATPFSLGSLGAKSARNVKLVEDILMPLSITTPYVNDGGNLTLEFTIEAADVVGAAQVFSSSFAFGTNSPQVIPSTSAGSPTVLVANFLNGNSDALNSRVYLWNPSASAGDVSVRVFSLPLKNGTAQELTTTPFNLGSLGAKSALNIKLAEDILTPLGIPTPYVNDGGNLTLEFTIEAADVVGAAQVFSPSFAFGTYMTSRD